MKVTRGFWEHEPLPLLALDCKRLRSFAVPKLTNGDSVTPLDIKSFIKAGSGTRKIGCNEETQVSAQGEAQSSGTRWNPTNEQVGILEMIYRGGIRTPNAQQIEQFTAQLSKYGKIEGKNVFYWFQNHKARERQKEKRMRNSLGLTLSPRSPVESSGDAEREEDSHNKRKHRSWVIECFEEDSRLCGEVDADKTLELFPLHPEDR